MVRIGGFDDGFEVGVSGRPGQLGFDTGDVGHELVGVAGAARIKFNFDWFATHTFNHFNYFEITVPVTGAGVVARSCCPANQSFSSEYEGKGEIEHVNIIANASTVRGWVVVAKEDKFFTCQLRINNVRDEVR